MAPTTPDTNELPPRKHGPSSRRFTVTEAQLEAVVERGVRKALAEIGLKVDDPDTQYEANADFRWVRQNRQDAELTKTLAFATMLRKRAEGASGAIGLAVIAAAVGGLAWLFTQGLNFWKVH